MSRSEYRNRFAEAAREERPDLALLCLLIGAEAAAPPSHAAPAPAPADDGTGGSTDDNTDDSAEEDAEEGAADGGEPCRGDPAGLDRAQIELDRLAGLLPYERGRTPVQWARAVELLLGEECGFRGTQADYMRLESSLLQAVLERRRGLPILLSVVWIEVARRAGAPVYGVALPGHFVVGFGDPSGEYVLADPFGGGRLLAPADLALLMAGATGRSTPVSDAVLQPADPLEIVLRILNNIRAWAAARPERSDVQLWALELSLLLPHHPARLRYDRAQLLVERGDFIGGAREMEAYAEIIAAMEPSAADTVRRAARAARARLN